MHPFEKQVLDLFRLKGFEPLHDVVAAGRQHDLILYSSEESIQPILVECKYHDPRSKGQVSVVQVNDFAATVIRLRNSGNISAGYLITNTGFTGKARGAFFGLPENNFVFLRTVNEIRRSLVNFDRYLANIVKNYEIEKYDKTYEPLNAKSRSNNKSGDVIKILRDFVNEGKKQLLVLSGDYGTGKTTACRRLSYLLASNLLNDNNGRIPVFIPLKWYGQSGSSIALLNRFLQEEGLQHSNVDSLLSMHVAGQLVLVFDGFDEMLRRSTKLARRETIQDLIELCVPNGKIILSGRPGYFSDDSEINTVISRVGITGARDRIRQIKENLKDPDSNKWLFYDLEPLGPSQIRSFLEKQSPYKSSSSRKKHVDNIMNLIEKTYNLGDLAKRPILLEMIAETVVQKDMSLAINPATLYSLYVDTWLQIDADKGAFRNLISPDDRRYFSIVLAWILQDSGIQQVHWKELQNLVSDYFRLEEADDIDHFSSDVRTCTFLSRDDEGYLKFAHLSFQEYFCARFLVEGDEELKYLFHDILIEPQIDLMGLWERSPAVLDFVADILDCPVSPGFWDYVQSVIAERPLFQKFIEANSKRNNVLNAESLFHLTKMAYGETIAFELCDLADAYRGTYKFLCKVALVYLEENPTEKWLKKFTSILLNRRL